MSTHLFRMVTAFMAPCARWSPVMPMLSRSAGPDGALAADTALVLTTSGTTAEPRLVPLSHANLLAAADSIRAVLQLTPAHARGPLPRPDAVGAYPWIEPGPRLPAEWIAGASAGPLRPERRSGGLAAAAAHLVFRRSGDACADCRLARAATGSAEPVVASLCPLSLRADAPRPAGAPGVPAGRPP